MDDPSDSLMVTFDTKDAKRFARALEMMPGELRSGLHKAAGRVGIRYLGYHRKRHILPASAELTPGKVRARGGKKGRFRKAFTTQVRGLTLGDLTLEIRARGHVSRQLQTGGEIYAKDGSYMAVPLPPARNNKGWIKKKTRDYLKSGRLTPIKVGKRRFLVLKTRKSTRFLFQLVKRVKVRKRLGFLGRTWRSFVPQGMRDFQYGTRAAVRNVFKRAKAVA